MAPIVPTCPVCSNRAVGCTLPCSCSHWDGDRVGNAGHFDEYPLSGWRTLVYIPVP
ncbi:MAG: hypothetical protein HY785_22500 [Oscillatoriophycideae cyanobacterium NC_groundwater_1537_Pr4_S-0.65um_50_18]|nr:hypothetical protein [Oscillatoriophycideae cyanobacterium NC_groundwater_1537_Pr4_S-0.65um_50_18]